QLLSKDPKIQKTVGKTLIVLSKEENGIISVDDRLEILSSKLLEQLSSLFMAEESWEVIEIEVTDGKPSLLNPRTLVDRLKLLQNEVDDARTMLQEMQRTSGLAELSGAGIIVYVYDAEGDAFRDQRVSD